MLLHVVPLTCFIARILRGPWDVIAEFGGERLKTGPLLSIPNALCHAQSVFGQHCRNLMANMAAEQVWLLPGPTPLQWKLFAASCAEMPLNRFTTLCRKDAQAVITSAFRSKWVWQRFGTKWAIWCCGPLGEHESVRPQQNPQPKSSVTETSDDGCSRPARLGLLPCIPEGHGAVLENRGQQATPARSSNAPAAG
jgi:hypothetical protein